MSFRCYLQHKRIIDNIRCKGTTILRTIKHFINLFYYLTFFTFEMLFC